MKCEANWAFNSLKVLMELGVRLLNQILAGPFCMIGKALHMISSSTFEGASESWKTPSDLKGP